MDIEDLKHPGAKDTILKLRKDRYKTQKENEYRTNSKNRGLHRQRPNLRPISPDFKFDYDRPKKDPEEDADSIKDIERQRSWLNVNVDEIISLDEQRKYVISFMKHLFPPQSYHHVLASARATQDSELKEFHDKLDSYKTSHKIELTQKNLEKLSEDPSLKEIDEFDEDEPEDLSHRDEYYDDVHKKMSNREKDASMKDEERDFAKLKKYRDRNIKNDERKRNEKTIEEKGSLYNKSYDELKNSRHPFSKLYDQKTWDNVGRVIKQSNGFRSLRSNNSKIAAHKISLDLFSALTKSGISETQAILFCKDLIKLDYGFFLMRIRGPRPSSGEKEIEHHIGKDGAMYAFDPKNKRSTAFAGTSHLPTVKRKDEFGSKMLYYLQIGAGTSYEKLPKEFRKEVPREDFQLAQQILASNKHVVTPKEKSQVKQLNANQQRSYMQLLLSIVLLINGVDDYDSETKKQYKSKSNIPQNKKKLILQNFNKNVSQKNFLHAILREEDETSEDGELLTERTASIRWRRNPRTHLNKIVMTCKTGEYKKSLNKQLKVAGQTVKEVMCLPSSTKPAAQKAKDRISSLKRWRKIKANPGKMTRSKLKGKMTKRFSKTLR